MEIHRHFSVRCCKGKLWIRSLILLGLITLGLGCSETEDVNRPITEDLLTPNV